MHLKLDYFPTPRKRCSHLSFAQPGFQYVHCKFNAGFWLDILFCHIPLYFVVCATLQPRGTPCVLTLQTHTGLPQPLCRHSGLYSCSITVSTISNHLNLFRGTHWTQWGIKYRNTTSTQYFFIRSSSSPLSPPPDMGIILFLGGRQ